MSLILKLSFLFFVGSVLGWCIELLFRRILHKKWINPGFLIGPYLPIYGFGLVGLYLMSSIDYGFIQNELIAKIVAIVIMTLCMTLIEYVTGLIFVYGFKVKLWDYSDRKWNIQGIICPTFTVFWAIIVSVYYLLIHTHVLEWLLWFENNITFSFVIGMFFGVMFVDFGYSVKIVTKIRGWAVENDVIVKYEKLKENIRSKKFDLKMKVGFMFPFASQNGIIYELNQFKDKIGQKKKK